MIAYFKDINKKSIKKYKKYKTLTTIFKTFSTIAIFATTSSSITLSLTGIGLIVIPITTASVCFLSIGNKVLYEIILQKYNKYKKQYEKHQQTIKSFVELYRKSLQDNAIDKNEYEGLCNILLNYLDETKSEPFPQTLTKK